MKIIKLSAEWCCQCKSLTDKLDSMGIKYDSVDVESDYGDDLATKYKVRSLPTMIILDDNDEFLGKLSGNPSEEVIKSFIDKYETN